MKKFIHLLVIILLLSGCINEQSTTVSTNTNNAPTNIAASDKIIDRSGKIENKERLG